MSLLVLVLLDAGTVEGQIDIEQNTTMHADEDCKRKIDEEMDAKQNVGDDERAMEADKQGRLKMLKLIDDIDEKVGVKRSVLFFSFPDEEDSQLEEYSQVEK